MPNGDFSVARVEKRTRESVGKFERHIERKNESYENMNVDLSRTPMNVHFQGCGELTYNEHLDRMIANGAVSLKGLKADATVFNEMILDVNTDYFERNGGYDFACRFYEEAFHFAEKLYGKDNIISAVMHADELNIAMTEKYGKPIYHYHLHIMALPVVDKEVRWSKRCKDQALVGTVKEVIHQVSHSKKWKSEKALDENGNPVLNSKGKPVYRASYSILQDKFYEYMKNAGFEGFERGERGSTAENLTSLGYKIQQDEKRLADIQQKIAAEQVRYNANHKAFMTFAEVMSYNHGPMLSKEQYDTFMLPYYRQLVPILREHDTKILIDTDGFVEPLIPWFLEAGIEGILPLERMAGVDVNRIRENFPDLIMIGGFDKTVMHKGEEAMRAEFERILPAIRSGGYIPSVDHQTPPDVSMENYRIYMGLLREYAQKVRAD